jgi:hypothetical protein
MPKALLGFILGFLVGIAVLAAGRYYFDMTIPFRQDSLGVGVHSHMKLFVHDLTSFHGGSFDTDAYQIWF